MRTSIPGFAAGFLIEPTTVTLRCAPPGDGTPVSDDGGRAASHPGAAPWLALACCASHLRRRRQRA